MPALGEGEVDDVPSENEDPLPKKLQSSVVRTIMVNNVHMKHVWSDCLTVALFHFLSFFLFQSEILISDLVVCSMASVLTFAVTASTVFLSLRVSSSDFKMLTF